MRIRSLAKYLLVLAFLAVLTPTVSQAEANTPVERLNATLLHVMQNADQLGYKGRYEALAPVLTEAFNFPVMARISVGKHWASLNKEQKKQLTLAFARLSVATFAARFDGYGGETFEIRGERNNRKNVIVDNVLVKSDGEVVPINYVVRKFDRGWRIIDIYLDAKYSELAIRRSEYSAMMENEGFETLMSSIEDKIATYAAEG